eukprot:757281-Hanusia_phi.AAC.1
MLSHKKTVVGAEVAIQLLQLTERVREAERRRERRRGGGEEEERWMREEKRTNLEDAGYGDGGEERRGEDQNMSPCTGHDRGGLAELVCSSSPTASQARWLGEGHSGQT